MPGNKFNQKGKRSQQWKLENTEAIHWKGFMHYHTHVHLHAPGGLSFVHGQGIMLLKCPAHLLQYGPLTSSQPSSCLRALSCAWCSGEVVELLAGGARLEETGTRKCAPWVHGTLPLLFLRLLASWPLCGEHLALCITCCDACFTKAWNGEPRAHGLKSLKLWAQRIILPIHLFISDILRQKVNITAQNNAQVFCDSDKNLTYFSLSLSHDTRHSQAEEGEVCVGPHVRSFSLPGLVALWRAWYRGAAHITAAGKQREARTEEGEVPSRLCPMTCLF